MSVDFAALLRSLLARHLTEAEVYAKRGRSRRVEVTGLTETSSSSQEKGWAVRAGHRKGSFFVAGTGEPLAGPWPDVLPGRALDLPEPSEAPAWSEPSDLDTPLIGEREAVRLLHSLGRELAAELPAARLVKAVLEDGSSESELVNSHGIKAKTRSRVTTLYLEAAVPGAPLASLYVAAREARRFHPTALARRLADRLAVTSSGAPPERDGGEVLLAPPVATRVLAGLAPLLVGAGASLRSVSPRGRLGSDRVTLIDNGRLAGGLFEAPVDGEGVSTREIVLVDNGIYRQPLLAWWEEGKAAGVPSGCSRRAGWRDLPVPGPTHLYVKPEPRTSVAALLGSISQGYYLIDVTGPGHFDFAEDRFALPVCGFAVQSGRASAPVARAFLCGAVSSLLRGVSGVGRDLTFYPLDGMIGSPTLLVTGLELRKGRD